MEHQQIARFLGSHLEHMFLLSLKKWHFLFSQILGPNAANIHIIADLYAEVLGVLAQSR